MTDGLRIGVDIGGTFTDVCLVAPDGRSLTTAKIRTTPDDPSRAVVEGVRLATGGRGAVEQVVHATTLITNALVQRRGATVGLLVTRGFLDTLEIARQHRYDMYDLRLERPPPLVERRLRREVAERVLVDGSVDTPLDPDQVERLTGELLAAGAEAIAVCFLHCYANGAHERAAAEAVARAAPATPLSLSSRISGQMREYERMVTTVANAYVQPIAARYMERLAAGLAAVVPGATLSIMTSNGGVTGVAAALEAPVRLVESGPAAGALAAAADCALLDLDGLLSFDMGGTTAKACLVLRGADRSVRPDLTPEIEVARVYRFTRGSGLPLQVPSVELIEIGAGGGSIARIDVLGRMQVGPESAGAEPGPACYPSVDGQPRPDPDPTVTDADLVLGHVGADAFLGGQMRLDVEAARGALGRRLGGDPLAAAARVRAAVDEGMALAFRRHCAERGYDPSARPLYAFGGAGPVHACQVAELLGASRVLVPPEAGVGSAIGLLTAPPRVDLARTHWLRLDRAPSFAAVEALYREMEAEARALLGQDADLAIERSADLRFLGQAHQLTVDLPPGWDAQAIARAFEQHYARIYGRVPPGVGVQALQWRLTARGPRPGVGARVTGDVDEASTASSRPDTRHPTPSTRMAWFDGALRETPVVRRERLATGQQVAGPLLVEEDASTTVLPPGWRLSVLPTGHLDLRRGP